MPKHDSENIVNYLTPIVTWEAEVPKEVPKKAQARAAGHADTKLMRELLDGWNRKLERKHLWANLGQFGSREPPSRRGGGEALPLADADLQRVDRAFVRAVGVYTRRIAVVLSEEPAEEEASGFYVLYEPAADFVFALSTSERRACLCTHYKRWEALRPEFLAVQERISHHLAREQFIDALLACMEEVETVAKLLAQKPELPA